MDTVQSVGELQGSQILFKRANCSDVLEGDVMALSADGKYVKLDDSGKWYPAAEISVLEVLARAPVKTAKAAKVPKAAGQAANPDAAAAGKAAQETAQN